MRKRKGTSQSSSATSAMERVDPILETPKRKKHKSHKSSKKSKDLPSTSKMTLREVQDLMVEQGFGHHFQPCPRTPGAPSPEKPHYRGPSLQRDPSPEVLAAPVLQILSLGGPSITEDVAVEQSFPEELQCRVQGEVTDFAFPDTGLQESSTAPKLDSEFTDIGEQMVPPASPESVRSMKRPRSESGHSEGHILPDAGQFVKLADLQDTIQSTVQEALMKQMAVLFRKTWEKTNEATLPASLGLDNLSDISTQDSPISTLPNVVLEAPEVTPTRSEGDTLGRSPESPSGSRTRPTSFADIVPEHKSPTPHQDTQGMTRSPPLLQELVPVSAFDPSSLYGEEEDWEIIEATAPEESGGSTQEGKPVEGAWTIQINQHGDLRALDTNGQLLKVVVKAVPSVKVPKFFVWTKQAHTSQEFKKAPWFDYASTDIYSSAKNISALTKDKIFVPTTIDEGKPALILPTLNPGPWINWFEDGELFASQCALSLGALAPVPKQRFGDCRVAACQPLSVEINNFLNASRIVLRTLDNKWFPTVDAKYLEKDFRHRQRAARMVASLQINMALGQAMDNLKQMIEKGTPQQLCAHIKQLHLANSIQGVEDVQSAIFEAVRTRQILRWNFVKTWPAHIRTKVMQSSIFTAPIMDPKIWSAVYWELSKLEPPKSPELQQAQSDQSAKGKQLLNKPQPRKRSKGRESQQSPSRTYHYNERKESVASHLARRPSPERDLPRQERRSVPLQRGQFSRPWYYERPYYR